MPLEKEEGHKVLADRPRSIAVLTAVLIIAVSAGAAVAIPVAADVIDVGPGEPEIVEVSDITIAGGGQATLTAKVKNVGYTEDTFIPQLDLPDGMHVIYPAGSISIPVDQTRDFEWTVAVGDVESARTESATLRVVAKNSLLDDTASFSVTMNPGSGPPIKTGDLTVYVLDAETDVPLAGAEVTCAGLKTVTGTDGAATINDIREGDRSLAVSLEGYGGYSETIHIREGTNSRTVRLSEVKPWSMNPWPVALLALALGIGIAVILGGVIFVGKKKGWWLR